MPKSLVTKHVIESMFKFDKDSAKELKSELRSTLADASSIDFDTPETRENLRNLARVFEQIFAAGNIQGIDFKNLIKMPPADMFAELGKLSANEFWDAWNVVSGSPANLQRMLKTAQEQLRRTQQFRTERRVKTFSLLTGNQDQESVQENLARFDARDFAGKTSEQIQNYVNKQMQDIETALQGLSAISDKKELATRVRTIGDMFGALFESVRGIQNIDSMKHLTENKGPFSISKIVSMALRGGIFTNSLRAMRENEKQRLLSIDTSESDIIVQQINELRARIAASQKSMDDIESALGGMRTSGGRLRKNKITEVRQSIADNQSGKKLNLAQRYAKYQETMQDQSATWVDQNTAMLNFITAYDNATKSTRESEFVYKELRETLRGFEGQIVSTLGTLVHLADVELYPEMNSGSEGGAGDASSAELEAERARADAAVAEAKRERRARIEAEQKTREYVEQLDKLGSDVLTSNEADKNLQKRKEILKTMEDEGLLTESLKRDQEAINQRLEGRADLIREAEGYYDDIENVLGDTRVDAIDSEEQYRKDHLIPFDNVISRMYSSGLFSEEELYGSFDAISNTMEQYAKEIGAKTALEQLDGLFVDPEEIDDAEELNRILQERNSIIERSSEYDMRQYDKDELDKQLQLNNAIKDKIALLYQVESASGVNVEDEDELELIQKENGALEDKLEVLRDIAEEHGNNITQKSRDRHEQLTDKDTESGLTSKEEERLYELEDQISAADESLMTLEQTYDRIILKLSNGKKLEILPNDKGLRDLYKIADEYGTYNGYEVDDVIFERVKQESEAHQENAAAIEDEAAARDKLNRSEREVVQNNTITEESARRTEDVQKTVEQSKRIISIQKEWLNYLDAVLDDNNFKTSGKKEAADQLRRATKSLVDYRMHPDDYPDTEYGEEKRIVAWNKAYEEAQRQGVAERTLTQNYTDAAGDYADALGKLQAERKLHVEILNREEEALRSLTQAENVEAEVRRNNADATAIENEALLEQQHIKNSDNTQAEIAEERASAAATEARTDAQRELNAAMASEPDVKPASTDVPATSNALAETNIDGTAETKDMTTLLAAVQAVTAAVKLKTKAFWTEKVAVDQVVAGEVSALDELEGKLGNVKQTLEGLLNNIGAGANNLSAGLSNINVTVNNPNVNTGAIEHDLNNILAAVNAINSKVVKSAGTGSGNRSKNQNNSQGSTYFKERKKTTQDELDKFEEQLKNAGRYTAKMQADIQQLRSSLGAVNNSKQFGVWNQKFRQIKLADDISKLQNEPQKNQIEIYKQLIKFAKEYYKLVERYEKAEDNSLRKATLKARKEEADQFFAAAGINLDTLQLGDVKYDTQLSDLRIKHKNNMTDIAAAKADKQTKQDLKEATEKLNEEKELVKDLTKLYEQLGAAQAKRDSELLTEADRQKAEREANEIRGRISHLRKGYSSTRYREDQFASAKTSAYKQASDDILSKHNNVVDNLSKKYDKLGMSIAKAEAENDREAQARNEQRRRELDQEIKALGLSERQTEELNQRLHLRMQEAAANERNLIAIGKQQDAEEAIKKAKEAKKKADDRANARAEKEAINSIKRDAVELGKLYARQQFSAGADEDAEIARQIKALESSIALKQKGLNIDQKELDQVRQKALETEKNKKLLVESHKQSQKSVRETQQAEKKGVEELLGLWRQLGAEIAERDFATNQKSKDAHQQTIKDIVFKIKGHASYDEKDYSAGLSAMQDAKDSKSISLRQRQADKEGAEEAKVLKEKIKLVKKYYAELGKLKAGLPYAVGGVGSDAYDEIENQIAEREALILLQKQGLNLDQTELDAIENKAYETEKSRKRMEDANAKSRQAVRDAQQEEKAGVANLIQLYEQLGNEKAMQEYAKTPESKAAHQQTLNELVQKIRANAYYDSHKQDGISAMRNAYANKNITLRQRQADNAGSERINQELKEERHNLQDLIALYKELGRLVAERNAAMTDAERDAKQETINKKVAIIRGHTSNPNGTDDDAIRRRKDMRGYFERARDARSDRIREARAAQSGAASQRDVDNKIKALKSLYKKAGELSAKLESKQDQYVEADLNEIEKKIKAQINTLGLDEQEEKNLKDKLNILKEEERARVANLLLAQKQKESAEAARKQSLKDARFGKAQSVLNTGTDLTTSLSAIDPDVNWDDVKEVGLLKQSLTQLENQINAIRNSDGVISPEDQKKLKQQIASTQEYVKQVRNVVNVHREMSGDDAIEIGLFDTKSIKDWKQQLTAAVQQHHDGAATINGFDEKTQSLTYTIHGANNELTTYTARINTADGTMKSFGGTTKKTESFMDSLKRKIKEISSYVSATSVMYKALASVRQGIQYVREIDSALTELKKVTDETTASYDKFLKTAAKTASKVGSTIQEIVSSTADWARLGYDMTEAANLAESTSVLLNVSEFQSIDEATSALVSTMQAFGYTAEQSMDVVDVMNQIGNNFAVSSDGIATALQDSASALMTANNSYEEAVAMVASANRVIQNPSEVGGALRTIALRLRGTSVKELEEMGEDTTGAVETKSKLRSKLKTLTGIDILTDTGAYKSTYQILLEISKVWKEISDEDRAAALELISGKNRANVASALLTNTKDLEEAYKSALNAEGSAYAENEKYLDSIQGRIDLLTNELQSMWSDTLDSDVIKWFVDIGTEVIKLVHNVGLLETAIFAVLTYFSLKKQDSLDWAKILGIHTIKDGMLPSDGLARKFFNSIKTQVADTKKTVNGLGESVKNIFSPKAIDSRNNLFATIQSLIGNISKSLNGLKSNIGNVFGALTKHAKNAFIKATSKDGYYTDENGVVHRGEKINTDAEQSYGQSNKNRFWIRHKDGSWTTEDDPINQPREEKLQAEFTKWEIFVAKIKGKTSEAINNINEFVNKTKSSMIRAAQDGAASVHKLVDPIRRSVRDVVNQMAKTISATTDNLAQSISKTIENIRANASSAATKLKNSVKEIYYKATNTSYYKENDGTVVKAEKVRDAASAKDYTSFTRLKQKLSADLSNMFQNAESNVKYFILSAEMAFVKLRSKISGIKATMTNVFKSGIAAVNKFVEPAKKAFNSFGAKVRKVFDDIANYNVFSKLQQNISNALNNITLKFKTWGTNIKGTFSGIFDGLKARMSHFKTAKGKTNPTDKGQTSVVPSAGSAIVDAEYVNKSRDALAKYNKKIDDTTTALVPLSENTSLAVQETKDLSDGAEDAADGVEELGESAKGAEKIGAKISHLMLNLGVNLGITALIKLFTTLLGKVKEFADTLYTSFEESKEQFDDLSNELSSTESEISDLTNQLNDIEGQIDEINSNPLEFADKENLERLKEQSAELERQIGLQEALREQQQKKVNKQAVETGEKYLKTDSDGETLSDSVLNSAGAGAGIGTGLGIAVASLSGAAGAAGTAMGAKFGATLGSFAGPIGTALGLAAGAAIGAAVGGLIGGGSGAIDYALDDKKPGEAIDSMQENYNELKQEYDTARKKYLSTKDDKDYEKYTKAQEALSAYEGEMSEYISQLSEYANAIDWDTATEEEKQFVKETNDTIDKWLISSGADGAKANAIERIFGKEASDTLQKAKQEIENAMRSDSADNFDFFAFFDEEDLRAFKNRLYDIGLSITDVEYYFRDLSIAEQEATEVFDAYGTIKQLNVVSDGVGSLKEAFTEFDEQGLVTAGTLESLYEKFGHLEDAWTDYINVMSSAATSTEQAERATKELAEAFVNDKLADGPIEDLQQYAILLTQLSSMGFKNPKEYLDAKQKTSMVSNIAKSVVGDENWNGSADDALVSQYATDFQKQYGITLSSAEDWLLVEKAITAEKARQNAELVNEKEGAAEALEIAKKRLEEEKNKVEYKPISEVGTNVSSTSKAKVYRYKDAYGDIQQSFTGDELVAVSISSEELVDSYEKAVDEAQEKYDSIKVPVGINTDNAEEEAQKAEDEYQRALDDQGLKIELELKNFDNDIDEIQDSYSTLSDVVKEYNKNKFLSLDNLQALLNLEPEYLACLQMENGQLSINQAAMEAMVQAKLAEAKATVVQKAITELNTLAQRKEADATIDSANAAVNAIGNLGAYADTLGIIAQEAIVAAGSVAAFNSAVAGAEANELVSQEEIDTVLSNMETQLAMIDSVSTNLSSNFKRVMDPDRAEKDEDELIDKLKKKYERQLAMLDAQKQYLENEISRLEAENKPVSKSLYEEQIKIEEKKLKLYEQERKELLAQMNTVPKHSDDWWEMAEAVWDVEHAIQESTLSIVEMKDAITQLYIDAFDDVGGAHANKLTFLDDQKQYIEDYMSYLETLGIEVPDGMYEKLIATEQQSLEQNYAKLADLQTRFTEAKKNGAGAGENSEEWVRMSEEIRQVESDILASKAAMAEWNKEMRDAEWGKFDELMERIEDVESEMDNLAGLFSDDKIANEDGTWTKEGVTQLGLLYQQMISNESAAEEYGKKMEQLKEEYDAGKWSEAEYYEKLQELKDGQWDAIEATESQKDAIVDLHEARVDEIKNGIEKEIEAYEELIKVKRDELDAERDLHDFRNNIKDQTKDITTLERRIAAMSGSTDAATVAERTRLEAELREKRDSLNDTYYDHSMDAQSNALDEEQTAFEKSKNDYIEQLEQTLENTKFLIEGTMYDVLANADIVLNGINTKADEYGLELSPKLTTPWNAAKEQAYLFKEGADEYVRSLINPEGVICLFNSEANTLIAEVFTSGTNSAGRFNTDVNTLLSGMYAEGGSVTVFSSIAAKKFQDAFGAGNTAATKFKGHVASQIDLIRADINSENPLLTKYLKQPWTDGQNAANTFSTQTEKVLDALVKKANSTAKDIGTYADGIIADMKAAQRAIDETGGKSSGGGGGGGDGEGDTPPATKTIKGYNATATWNNGPAKIAAQGSGKTKKDAEQNALNKLGTAYMKVKTAGGASELHVQKAWQDILKYQKYKITSTPYYAKGTTGTKKDQWAITDEPQYGDELVLVPGKDGNLSYMRKGTSVIPADISENLMKLGMNPNFTDMSNGIKGINIMTNYVNKPELKLDIENFLHVDNVSQDTMPELKKFVKEQVNSMVKQLNYGLKRN